MIEADLELRVVMTELGEVGLAIGADAGGTESVALFWEYVGDTG